MEPVLLTALLQVMRAFALAVFRAVVPLVLGLVGACIAGGFYAAFLREDTIGGFFSSASGVSVGVLLALIVNGVARAQSDAFDRQIRAGTVALAAVGSFSALTGQLVTGSSFVSGLLFALTWGGMAAGILGLVYFVRVEVERPGLALDSVDLERLRLLAGATGERTGQGPTQQPPRPAG